MAHRPPYPNCKFHLCDLPGQCVSEGACHHPLDDPKHVGVPYYERVAKFMRECFGGTIPTNTTERSQRFLEEALELVQSFGMSGSDAHILVDYVFSRPVGERKQELGGTVLTLYALANAEGLNVEACAEDELLRAFSIIDKIRAKQAAKRNLFGPLP